MVLLKAKPFTAAMNGLVICLRLKPELLQVTVRNLKAPRLFPN